MIRIRSIIPHVCVVPMAVFLAIAVAAAAEKPVKVFILAGQSNMEGPANISTFDYIGDDPATAPLLKMMRGADGKPATCEGAWISYLTGAGEKNFTLHGKLTAGYGSMWGMDPSKPGDKIGPEFTFGLTMDAALEEPVLIIKAAWGGKSLHTDFRPPSAGPFVMPKETQKLWEKHPRGAHGIPKAEDRPKWQAEKTAATGVYYRLMMEHVKNVLADPKKVLPDYDPAQGYELAGFTWLQGFNDMVDGQVYPRHNQPDRYAAYSDLLAHFIRDVRKELNAPKLPFVIGVMGVGGLKDQSRSMTAFRNAMAAPAEMAEFKGNVVAVQTAPFWSHELGAIDAKRDQVRQMSHFLNSEHKDHANADGKMTDVQKQEYLKKFEADLITPAEVALWKRGASNAGYHYLGCAKTFALMGKHFAEANLAINASLLPSHLSSLGTQEPPVPAIEPGSPFLDHAILQREMPLPVWGWSKPGSTVTVEFAGQKESAKAGADGKWMLKLKPLKASAEPAEMVFSDSEGNKAAIKNILVGEVWHASGQSNMEWFSNKSNCMPLAQEMAKAATEVPIRELRTDTVSALYPQEKVTSEAGWKTSRSASGFSALALSFAHELRSPKPPWRMSASSGQFPFPRWKLPHSPSPWK